MILRNWLFAVSMVCLCSPALAATATIAHQTIGCRSMDIWHEADGFYQAGDDVAAKKFIKQAYTKGKCTIIDKGTKIFFYHRDSLGDGDYAKKTTVRRAGETTTWVIDKCALDKQDEDLEQRQGHGVHMPECKDGISQ